MLNTMLQGAMISGSMIVAIGTQNVFVLKQGLLRNNIFYVAMICFFGDLMLMTVGTLGFGQLIGQSLYFTKMMAILGALFLLYYGVTAFISSYKGNNKIEIDNLKVNNRKKVILSTLAITFLNPHVYLDTVVIIGSITGPLSFDEKVYFLIGALIASFIWFFSLAYGAKYLLPIFQKKYTWKIFDFLIGCIMFWIAYSLVIYTNF